MLLYSMKGTIKPLVCFDLFRLIMCNIIFYCYFLCTSKWFAIIIGLVNMYVVVNNAVTNLAHVHLCTTECVYIIKQLQWNFLTNDASEKIYIQPDLFICTFRHACFNSRWLCTHNNVV